MHSERTIVILLSPYISHIISSLRLMRLLEQRGYRIVYVNEFFLKKAIERYGFGFHHSGLAKTAQKQRDSVGLKVLIDTLVASYDPVLFIAEVGFWDTAMLVMGLKRKVLMIQPWACGDRTHFNLGKPMYGFSDKRKVIDFLKFEFHWMRNNLKNGFYSLIGKEQHSKYYKDVLKISGLSGNRHLSLYNRISYPRVVDIWELILYPTELDFPRKKLRNVKFIGPFVDTDRVESEFDWSVVKADTELVVCSLGSLSHWYDQQKRLDFYNEVFKAFTKLDQYTLVINVGDLYDEFCCSDFSDNILIFKSIPQITLLKKAKFFITHGGASSMKEAIQFGVQMIVYPWSSDSDMFGNASRIKYHHLGIIGDIKNDTFKDIIDHIHQLEKGYFETEVAKMKNTFLQYQEKEHIVIDFILSIVDNREKHGDKYIYS